jgi:hypothetical protein
VQPEDTVSSFVRRADEIVRTGSPPYIHYSRLMPRRNRTTNRLETSVFRTTDLTDTQVWDLCSAYYDGTAPHVAIGRGVGKASVVFAQALSFDEDGVPCAEHANIVGWHDVPGADDLHQKHFRKVKAQAMASAFHYSARR